MKAVGLVGFGAQPRLKAEKPVDLDDEGPVLQFGETLWQKNERPRPCRGRSPSTSRMHPPGGSVNAAGAVVSCLLAALVVSMGTAGAREVRIALVIGNGDYKFARPDPCRYLK